MAYYIPLFNFAGNFSRFLEEWGVAKLFRPTLANQEICCAEVVLELKLWPEHAEKHGNRSVRDKDDVGNDLFPD